MTWILHLTKILPAMSMDEVVATYVTADDFMYYWQRADERRSSSFTMRHDEHLAALQATKLNIAAKAGFPCIYGVLESPSCWRR